MKSTWRQGIVAAVLLTVSLPSVGLVIRAQEKGADRFASLSMKTDWPWWRGPHGNGISDSTPVPAKFSDSENLVWKEKIPGRGHSSPTVVGNRIYLTTADDQKKIHSLLILDRASGKLLKQVEINRGGFPEKNHPKNTEATSTIACDGERLFAAFYHHDKVEVVALDLTGKIVWRQPAGAFRPRTYEYGYAPSPIIFEDSLIVAGEYDGPSFIVALNRKTGKEIWRAQRPEMITFSTPVVAHVAGKDQLLISGAQMVAAYDPRSGKRLWSTEGTTFATCGTMVWDNDIVFASGGYPKAETLAVKADGSKQVLWRNKEKCYEQSMLATNGYLYALTDNGVMICWRGSDGKEMWKQRLRGPVSASPVLANGLIYWANEHGTLYVMKANPDKFDLVAENQIGTDSFASPAICGGQIFLRVATRDGNTRQEYLYCFAEKGAK